MEGETHFGYSLADAIRDGDLFEIFKGRWDKLSGGKPIVASIGVYHDYSAAAWMEIWNEYVDWRTNKMAKLPEAEQFFKTQMNGEYIFVEENDVRFLISEMEEY